MIFRSNSWPNRITSAFLDCCADKVEKEAKKAISAKEAKRERGKWDLDLEYIFILNLIVVRSFEADTKILSLKIERGFIDGL